MRGVVYRRTHDLLLLTTLARLTSIALIVASTDWPMRASSGVFLPVPHPASMVRAKRRVSSVSALARWSRSRVALGSASQV